MKKKKLRKRISTLENRLREIRNCASDGEVLSADRLKDDGVAGTVIWLLRRWEREDSR